MKIDCPLNHEDATWCLDCSYKKEKWCDYPHAIMENVNNGGFSADSQV